MSHAGIKRIVKLDVTANTTVVIPPCYSIFQIVIDNNVAASITGGLNIGTSASGSDVVSAHAVPASYLGSVPSASILKTIFSTGVDTTLYIEAATDWNGSSIHVTFVLVFVSLYEAP